MTKETYFEELSFALRRRELLPRPVEEDGLLQWSGTAAPCAGSRSAVLPGMTPTRWTQTGQRPPWPRSRRRRGR